MVKSISLNFIVKSRRVLFFLLILLGLAFVPAHADDITQTQIYNLLNNSQYGQSATYNRINNIYNQLYTYLPNLTDIKNSVSSMNTDLGYLRNQFQSDFLNTTGKWWRVADDIRTYTSNTASYAYAVNQILLTSDNRLMNIQSDTRQLQEVLANATDVAIRQDQAARVDQVNNDFLSSSGSASVSLGDLGSASDSITELKGSLSGGASASSLWSVLGSGSDGWGWFSSATASDLDSSGSLMEEQHFIFLEQYYSDLGLALGGDYND